ncbi:MAG: hypothetical protein R3C44_24460 [Chloroflexota bacterium]
MDDEIVSTDEGDPAYGQFWYIAYHTLSNLYLTGDYESFAPPAPFIRGQLPESPIVRRTFATTCCIVAKSAGRLLRG